MMGIAEAAKDCDSPQRDNVLQHYHRVTMMVENEPENTERDGDARCAEREGKRVFDTLRGW